jgi:hypothetical protein
LAQRFGSTEEILARRERDFLMQKANVKMLSSLENTHVGDYSIDKLEQGQMAEVPRWVAEELVAAKLAEVNEEPFETGLYRALSKEKLMGPMQLSPLQADFYVRMRRRVSYLDKAVGEGRARKEDVDRFRGACYDIVGMRLNKLLALAGSSVPASTLADRMTPEEAGFFANSQALSKEWKAALLGGGK